MVEEIRKTESGEVCCSAWNIRQDQWCPHPAKEDGLCKFHLDARHLNASLDQTKERTGVRPAGLGGTDMELDELREKVLELYASGNPIRIALETCGCNKWDLTHWRKVAWFREAYERIQKAKLTKLEDTALEMAEFGVWEQALDKNGNVVTLYKQDARHTRWVLEALDPKKWNVTTKLEHSGKIETDGLTDDQRAERIAALLDAARDRRDRAASDSPSEES